MVALCINELRNLLTNKLYFLKKDLGSPASPAPHRERKLSLIVGQLSSLTNVFY